MRFPRLQFRKWTEKNDLTKRYGEIEYSAALWVPVYPHRWFNIKASYFIFPSSAKSLLNRLYGKVL